MARMSPRTGVTAGRTGGRSSWPVPPRGAREPTMPSSRRTVLVAAATASVALVLSAFAAAPLFAKGASPKPAPPKSTPPPKPDPKAKDKDLIETLTDSKDPSFKTLLDALKAADLTTTLKGKGPFTLFAPTDDAFKKLPEGKLTDWMKP